MAVLLLGVTLAGQAKAETLADTLASAYKNSGLLEQNRALLRAADEDVAQIVSELRPILNWSTDISRTFGRTQSSNFPERSITSNDLTIGLSLDLLLYDFGRTNLRVQAAKETVLATRETLRSIEQQVLLRAVTAYMNVRRTRELVAVRRNNLGLLREELRAAEDRFEVGEVTTEERDDVAENTVTSSNPPAETAALQGSTVDLVVAAPPASVQVPGEVVGMTELEARGILEAPPFEFVVTTDVRSSPTIPAGTVMEIRPGPGELVQKGGDVLIIVSTGPEPVTVPPVIGRTEAQAVNTLSEAGLVVARVYVDVPAGDLDDGRVIAQSLPASSQVDPGTEITITVAKAVAPVTTLPPTTVAPTTMPPTTVAPTTVAPTTVAPTTDPPASSTP